MCVLLLLTDTLDYWQLLPKVLRSEKRGKQVWYWLLFIFLDRFKKQMNKQKRKQREDVCVCAQDGGNRMLASRGLAVV